MSTGIPASFDYERFIEDRAEVLAQKPSMTGQATEQLPPSSEAIVIAPWLAHERMQVSSNALASSKVSSVKSIFKTLSSISKGRRSKAR